MGGQGGPDNELDDWRAGWGAFAFHWIALGWVGLGWVGLDHWTEAMIRQLKSWLVCT